MAERLVDCGVPTTLWARRPASLAPFAGRVDDRRRPGRARPGERRGGDLRDRRRRGAGGGARTRRRARGHGGGERARGPLHHRARTSARRSRRPAPNAASHVVDAPVSGGGAAAAAGRLTVYVGGDAAAVARARPVLDHYGETVLHMGPLGSGLRTKLMNNALDRRALRAGPRRDGDRHRARARSRPARPTRCGRAAAAASRSRCSSGSARSTRSPITSARSWRRTSGCSRPATEAVADRVTLLATADRFLALVGHPRPDGTRSRRPRR